ncbi:cytochrome c oxidase accessory protein CcoG [bacterium]|nr:cytochrome c oxidase accessory protein CcoG [bacterium]
MQFKSSIRTDGSREKVRIADVAGRFTKARQIFFYVLMVIYALVPFIKVNGKPLIFIDILHRQFFLFGFTYNAQDFYLVFFLLSGALFTLFYITAVAGRLWCGWACPQTVFLEGVFRRIERLVEGPKSEQLLLAQSPWNFKKIVKFIIKHFLFVIFACAVSHIFLSYFVSMDELLSFVRHNPHEHWVAFIWMISITAVIYFNYAWFREQLCLIVCPYGKMQSALTDDDTLVIGYDALRGEPRGKVSDSSRGACINCRRCVDVCPTGIDIRNGLQLECIGCANCIDACDEIMDKVGQARGLVRYDSLNGLLKKPRHILRPRIYLYTVLFFVGLAVFSFFLFKRHTFEANILRAPGIPYVLTEGKIRNQYLLHVINKTAEKAKFTFKFSGEANVIIPFLEIELGSLEEKRIPAFAEMDAKKFKGQFNIILTSTNTQTGEVVVSQIPFLGP